MFLRGQFQNAYVTHDLEQAIEIMGNRFDLTDWQIVEPELTVNTLEGVKPMNVRVGLAWVNKLNIELIQPVSGYVDHYTSMMAPDPKDATPRFHHISVRREDEAEMREEIKQLGLPLAFEGPITSRSTIPPLVFVYLDARPAIGHYLEYTWKSEEGWDYMRWPKGRHID